jgi:hypothetical protein
MSYILDRRRQRWWRCVLKQTVRRNTAFGKFGTGTELEAVLWYVANNIHMALFRNADALCTILKSGCIRN